MTSVPLFSIDTKQFYGVLLACLILVGCGGGSSSGSGTNPPLLPADYSIGVSTTSLLISSSGGSQTVTVSIQPMNGFTGTVSVTVAALPTGVSASPASFSLTPGAQQAVVIGATLGTQVSAGTVTFQSTSGTLSHNALVSFSVAPETTVTQAHAPVRARFLATDGLTWGSVYDPVHKRFFLSDPLANEIDVFDAAQETQIGTIAGVAAWGMDISPYNGLLYAGTLWGDVYAIDPGALAITKRYLYSTIGPNGFAASGAKVLSDGRLALLGQVSIAGLNSFFGYNASNAAVWDPASNNLDTGANGTICPAVTSIGSLTVSGDRSHVLVSSSNYSGPVCSYDPVAKVATAGPAA